MVTLKQLSERKKQVDQLKPFSRALIENLNDWYRVELTYSSNAIEGNTLTRQETAQVVEKNLSVAGKQVKEHLEAINHAEAWNYVMSNKNKKIDEKEILKLHQMVLSKINDQEAGRYRQVRVRVAGSKGVVFPNSVKVPKLMKNLVKWLNLKSKMHPVEKAALFHLKLVSIHPFIDGNGRVARLLMNWMLVKVGYQPTVIEAEKRQEYILAIEKAQVAGDLDDYLQVIYRAVNKSLIRLSESVNQKSSKKATDKKLLKIGELAQEVSESVPTIRFWTTEGLLSFRQKTKGGYALYDSKMIKVVKRIRDLQTAERLTIKEIKARLR